jgi:Cache domain.
MKRLRHRAPHATAKIDNSYPPHTLISVCRRKKYAETKTACGQDRQACEYHFHRHDDCAEYHYFLGTFVRDIESGKVSLQERIGKESHDIYGTNFSKVEMLTESYADMLDKLPLDNASLLETISRSFVSQSGIIASGGYWLEYFTLPGKQYYGPYWYRDGSDIKLTWDYSNEKNDYTKADWYRNDGMATGTKVVWSELYNDAVTNVPMITATAAIVRNSKKAGVVTIDVGLKELTESFKSIKIPGLKTYSLSLVSKNGTCVVGSDPAMTGKKLYDFADGDIKAAAYAISETTISSTRPSRRRAS